MLNLDSYPKVGSLDFSPLPNQFEEVTNSAISFLLVWHPESVRARQTETELSLLVTCGIDWS